MPSKYECQFLRFLSAKGIYSFYKDGRILNSKQNPVGSRAEHDYMRATFRLPDEYREEFFKSIDAPDDLGNGKIRKNMYVHRAIYIFFRGNIPENDIVDHINDKRDDNRLLNLKAISRSENTHKSTENRKIREQFLCDIDPQGKIKLPDLLLNTISGSKKS